MEGNSCEALEFNLPKFGQFVMCKIKEHDVAITDLNIKVNQLEQELNHLRKQMKLKGEYTPYEENTNNEITL